MSLSPLAALCTPYCFSGMRKGLQRCTFLCPDLTCQDISILGPFEPVCFWQWTAPSPSPLFRWWGVLSHHGSSHRVWPFDPFFFYGPSLLACPVAFELLRGFCQFDFFVKFSGFGNEPVQNFKLDVLEVPLYISSSLSQSQWNHYHWWAHRPLHFDSGPSQVQLQAMLLQLHGQLHNHYR